jgi:Tfp pilus assembly protein PilV
MTAITSHSRSTKSRRTRRGFTLAEALIASVFLAIAAVGVAGTLAASSRTSEKIGQYANCQSLARELLEEVSSKSFVVQTNPGYSAGTHVRTNYDDMTDYDGYTDNTTTGIKTVAGAAITFGDNATYTRTVAFEYRVTPGGAKVSSGDFGMITVTVTSSGGASITIQRLVSATVLAR